MAGMRGCTDGETTILCVHRHCQCCYGSKECKKFRDDAGAVIIFKGLMGEDCNHPSHQRPGVDIGLLQAIKESEYPDAIEDNWPPQAKKSEGALTLPDGTLGKIVSDGERGYICTVCGRTVTKAHHIKPECYRIMYNGQAFYLERHVCDECMER